MNDVRGAESTRIGAMYFELSVVVDVATSRSDNGDILSVVVDVATSRSDNGDFDCTRR